MGKSRRLSRNSPPRPRAAAATVEPTRAKEVASTRAPAKAAASAAAPKPIVVVMDDGLDVTHPELKGSLWTNRKEIAGDGRDNDGDGVVDDVHGFDAGSGSGDPSGTKSADHGTHVSGIIAGIAKDQVELMPVSNVSTVEADDEPTPILDKFERAVNYVVGQKAAGANIRVVNASFGEPCDDPALKARWTKAVQRLGDSGILLVAAADNSGASENEGNHMPADVQLPNVLTVANMERTNDRLHSSSDDGDRAVELAAVGHDVLSTLPEGEHGRMTGTSMAAPVVSAAAALLFGANPSLTPEQVREVLMSTVDVDPDLAGRVSSGGKLNIARALHTVGVSNPEAVAAYAKLISANPAELDDYVYEPAAREAVAAIAKRFGTSVAELLRVNPPLGQRPIAAAGDRLSIPGAVRAVAKRGETLKQLVERLNEGEDPGSLTVAALAAWNRLKPGAALKAGQVLAVPSANLGRGAEE